MSIKAEEKQLQKIFSDDFVFDIPAYQRPYAWTTEQAGELLDDLLNAALGDGDTDYFLGSIVLIKNENQPRSEVVDGQQRLTTLTILFCALRDLINDPDDKGELDNHVRAKGRRLAGIEDRFRLTLRERDRDVFRQRIQQIDAVGEFVDSREGLPDSQLRFRENARHIWGALRGMTPSVLSALAEFLIRKCYLVVVSASDQESAYRIFAVMNDRGLNLSPTDILKAEIIGRIDAEQRAGYTSEWETIEEDLGRDDFRDLFAHIRMIHVKSKARGNLTREFREGVLANGSGCEFIDGTLSPMADAYRTVTRATFEDTERESAINGLLSHLGRIDNFDWVPPAMAFFHRHAADPVALEDFTRDLERLAYAMLILRWNINNRIGRYARILEEIENGADLRSADSPLQLVESEKALVREAINGPVYLQTRVCTPLLLRLDSELATEGVTYERKVLSVEHVLPQTPGDGSEWLDWFSNEEERGEWTHRLANLVLLSRRKNAQAQNFEFERKKNEYFRRNGVTTFAITSQVLDMADWTPEVLEERQVQLTDRLAGVWRL